MNQTNAISLSIIYTVTCATFVPIVYWFYPEVAGRSLEEIDAIFLESKTIFDCVGVARRMPRTRLADMPIQISGEEKGEKRQYAEVAAHTENASA